jgi:hypothetical protein
MNQSDIDRAIEKLSKRALVSCVESDGSVSYADNPDGFIGDEVREIAIEALRQYKPNDGCDYCTTAKYESAGIWGFCPNCGRALKGSE